MWTPLKKEDIEIKCPEDYDEVIYSVWPGTNMFCKCGATDFKLGEKCEEGSSCTTVSSSPAIVMDNLGSYKVCGKRNADPFSTVIRPVLDEI